MLTTSRKTVRPILKQPAPVQGVGIVKGNPTRCLKCRQPIREGEAWTKYTSLPEPDSCVYSIIVHDACSSRNGKH